MTGTLIQNKYEEMWSVLDFVVPGLVGRYEQWKNIVAKAVDAGMDQKATIGVIAEKKRITDRLHQVILPLLFLRRTKAEVALELPIKNDQVIFCPLTPIQEMVYRRIAAQPELLAFLKRQAPCPEHPSRRFKDCCGSSIKFEGVDSGIVFRYIDIFKKVASHIALVYSQPDDKPEQFPLDRDKQIQSVNLFEGAGIEGYIPEGFANIAEELGPDIRDLGYRKLRLYEASAKPEFSGKWLILHSLLRSWKADAQGHHKVLVFSSSVKLLKMLHDFIIQDYNCEMLHGGLKDDERVAAVDRFQNDENVFVFLIRQANKVIIFDPNWTLFAWARSEMCNQGGVNGDLWGATNLFTYHPEGTTLQRKARLAFEEEKIENNLDGIIDSDKIRSVKIDTSYGEGMDDWKPRGTEKGTEMTNAVTEDSTLLEVVGDLFPGLRREGVAKPHNKPSAAERFVDGQVAEDAKNPMIANRPANEYYQSEEAAKKLVKQNGRAVKRGSAARKTDDGARMAPRLNLPKSERYTGLVSDDE
ncbi:hypothetical protein QFC24_006859 [Naganishia onofrii]|uniref:Uncharacterized protein n=1 Tax=Naganishia onofrii TaxID=1851511 RepID=A0ACC2WW70_9TREE|nr:hypothetical protein QFC24_006859 [Naganishia onofrii]